MKTRERRLVEMVGVGRFREDLYHRLSRMDSYERYLLEQYIRAGSGRIEEVSRLAGIPRSSLYYLLKKHGLSIKKSPKFPR